MDSFIAGAQAALIEFLADGDQLGLMSEPVDHGPSPLNSESARASRHNWGRTVLTGVLAVTAGLTLGLQVDRLASSTTTSPARGETVQAPQSRDASAAAPSQAPGQTGTADGGADSGAGPGTTSPAGRGRRGGLGQQGTTQTTSRARASEAQSQGLALIDVSGPNVAGAGSGMVVGSDGLLVTNYHVVEGSTTISVTIAATGAQYQAAVLGRDEVNDVAVLKLANASGLTTITRDADGVQLGEVVSAIGNANGQGYLSVANGQVTSTNDEIEVADPVSVTGTSTLDGMIGTSAPAEPGDSGGALVDSEGDVVGMTSAGTTNRRLLNTSTVSYAITLDEVLAVVDQVQSGTSSASIQVGARAQLGIGARSGQAGLGVQVISVTLDSPAERAGLAAGDIIVAIDGTVVTSLSDLSHLLGAHSPGDRVTITWLDGQSTEHSKTVELGTSTIN